MCSLAIKEPSSAWFGQGSPGLAETARSDWSGWRSNPTSGEWICANVNWWLRARRTPPIRFPDYALPLLNSALRLQILLQSPDGFTNSSWLQFADRRAFYYSAQLASLSGTRGIERADNIPDCAGAYFSDFLMQCTGATHASSHARAGAHGIAHR